MNYNRTVHGFTLIEILIATTIFVTLIGIVASITANLASLSRTSLSVIEMHREAHIIAGALFKNYENSHITTAISLDFSKQNEIATTFMTNTHAEMDSGGNSHSTLVANPTFSDFVWNRFEFDFVKGQVRYGESRNPGSQRGVSTIREGTMHKTSSLHSGGISSMHRVATPQREFRFFEGTGAVIEANGDWVWDDDKNISASGKRRMYQHCAFETSGGDNGTDPRFTIDEKPHFFLYTHGMVGNRILLSEEAYAVRNQDGISYNKDRLNLIGSDDTTTHADDAEKVILYESQMRPLTLRDNVECGMLRYVRADGLDPNDDDTMSDANASLDVVGLNAQSQDAAKILSEYQNRPRFIECSFVLHNITHDIGDYDDIDGDPTTIYLTEAIRNQVHNIDGVPLNYANYKTQVKARQEAFIKLVEDAGFSAHAFQFAKKLP